MPRRTYADLGYAVIRPRLVLIEPLTTIIDGLAETRGVTRAAAIEEIIMRYKWLCLERDIDPVNPGAGKVLASRAEGAE